MVGSKTNKSQSGILDVNRSPEKRVFILLKKGIYTTKIKNL